VQVGDLVKATWSDGLVLTGQFKEERLGYILLIDEKGKLIVCSPNAVKFEVINESR